MNVLITGGGPGSWTIRGVQMGGALGARVVSMPSAADFSWADVIVLVKRAISRFRDQAVRSGKPVVWDALDFWQQPSQNSLALPDAVTLGRKLAGHDIAVIGATKEMAQALGGTYVPHHAWPGMTPEPAREQVRVVAYQGEPSYLGRWAGWVTKACKARGWQFVVNPPALTEADILVAFRDGQWDGEICREWKSGVKAVNALVAGRPLITQDSAGVREIQPVGSIIETPDGLAKELDHWASVSARVAAVEISRSRAMAYSLSSVAEVYRPILQGVACPA